MTKKYREAKERKKIDDFSSCMRYITKLTSSIMAMRSSEDGNAVYVMAIHIVQNAEKMRSALMNLNDCGVDRFYEG